MNEGELENLSSSTLSKENILIRRLCEENLALRKQNALDVINFWNNSPTKADFDKGMANKVLAMRKKIDIQKRYLLISVTFSALLLLLKFVTEKYYENALTEFQNHLFQCLVIQILSGSRYLMNS